MAPIAPTLHAPLAAKGIASGSLLSEAETAVGPSEAAASLTPMSQQSARALQLQEPLCQQGDDVAVPLSPLKATFALTQCILGAGVLALPFAIRSAGFAGGFGLLGLVYILTVFSMGALVFLANEMGEFSYKGQAVKAFGQRWSTFFEAWVLCYTLGICIGYPILLGDFLSAIARAIGLSTALFTPTLCMIVTVLAICWPFSCAPSLGALGKISIFGVLFVSSTVVVVMLRFSDGSYPKGTTETHWLNTEEFGSCFPILVGAFGAHFSIPSLYKEMAPMAGDGDFAFSTEARAAVRRTLLVIFSALTLCAAVYSSVGAVVYCLFGNMTHADFTENFREDDRMIIFVRGTMAFSLCISFPLVMLSARNSFYNLILKPRGWRESNRLRIMLATALVFFCLGLALVAGGNLGVVLTYNGSVFGTPVCYIAPGIMYLQLPRSSQKPVWRWAAAITATCGIVFGIFGVYQATVQSLAPPPPHPAVALVPVLAVPR